MPSFPASYYGRRCYFSVAPALILSVVIVVALFASPALGARVTLEWDRCSDPNVDGYRIHYGTQSGSYSSQKDVGDCTNATISGLDIGTTYYFAATSYNEFKESGYSNEVVHTPSDSDGDGLSDYDESHFYPTDQSSSDTDGDGMNDGYEMDYWSSAELDTDGDGTPNVTDADSDNDGVQDGQELAVGGDPETATDFPPVADAGPDRTCAPGSEIVLNGSNSRDPEGGSLSYRWRQVNGSQVELRNPSNFKSSFVVPEHWTDQALVFELTATDGSEQTDVDTCIVNVRSSSNMPPQATATTAQDIYAPGENVVLDASGSSDPEGGQLSYTWKQLSGSEVSLSGGASPSFAAPNTNASDRTLAFEVVVEDDRGLKDSALCMVNVSDSGQLPQVATEAPTSVLEGKTVQLKGDKSSGPEGTVIAHEWKQLGGPTAPLSDPDGASPYFVVPPVSCDTKELSFRHTVTSSEGLVSAETVRMNINDNKLQVDPAPGKAIVMPEYEGQDPVAVATGIHASPVYLQPLDPGQIRDKHHRPQETPFDMLSMDFRVEPGDTIEVQIIFDKPLPENCVWFKHDPFEGWSRCASSAQISDDRKKVRLTLTDGGTGDHDGLVNGIIVDPSGPAIASAVGGSGTSGSSAGGGCVYNPQSGFAWSWLLLLLPAAMLRGTTGRSLARKALRLDL